MSADGAPECPTHGRMHWIGGEWLCGHCEAAIARAEDSDVGDAGFDAADEIRYERWLDEIGGSR